ncbi:hypothetical protein B566_EDAN016699 [Ephemera danica]|nr:hypothetical protein B566_EDAN016699 [Ephemera danica]
MKNIMAEEKQKEPSMSSIFKRDWREKYRTSTEQYYYMYRKGIATDCTLVVDNDGKKEEIQVHRLQLVRASRQFHFLIAKGGSMNTQQPLRIVLNNFSPRTIRLMLRCIYEDKVELETFDDAINTILAAHLYEIKPLLDIGSSALIKYLTPDKVFIVWSITQTITLPDVMQSCIELTSMRTKPVTNAGKRRSNVCKRLVITKQPNLQMSLNTECLVCADPLQNQMPNTTPGKCLHVLGVFRVKSSCRLMGFECLSREFKTEDPTFIYKRSRTSYKECINVVLISYGLSLALDAPVNPRSKILCSMQYNEDSHYDSTIKIKFPQLIELKTNSWYGFRIMFKSAVSENVEYPHYTRPAKVTSTSGVEFRFQNKEIPGYINSFNDGVIKTLLLS